MDGPWEGGVTGARPIFGWKGVLKLYVHGGPDADSQLLGREPMMILFGLTPRTGKVGKCLVERCCLFTLEFLHVYEGGLMNSWNEPRQVVGHCMCQRGP